MSSKLHYTREQLLSLKLDESGHTRAPAAESPLGGSNAYRSYRSRKDEETFDMGLLYEQAKSSKKQELVAHAMNEHKKSMSASTDENASVPSPPTAPPSAVGTSPTNSTPVQPHTDVDDLFSSGFGETSTAPPIVPAPARRSRYFAGGERIQVAGQSPITPTAVPPNSPATGYNSQVTSASSETRSPHSPTPTGPSAELLQLRRRLHEFVASEDKRKSDSSAAKQGAAAYKLLFQPPMSEDHSIRIPHRSGDLLRLDFNVVTS